MQFRIAALKPCYVPSAGAPSEAQLGEQLCTPPFDKTTRRDEMHDGGFSSNN